MFNWQPHSDGACSQCQYFQKRGSGGRPKTTRKGRPKSREVQLVAEDPLHRLCKSACPSWNAPQALSLSSFLPPATGVHLSDLQCPFCSLVVDRPVQTACGKFVCCTCITEYSYKQRKNKEVETFPCCSGTHVTPPIPAAAVVTQVIGSLLLCCDTCKQAVALRDHTDSGCTTGIVSSQQTIEQILARPLCAPATMTEKKTFHCSNQEDDSLAHLFFLILCVCCFIFLKCSELTYRRAGKASYFSTCNTLVVIHITHV